MVEQSGREVLETLLRLLDGVELPTDTGSEPALRPDVNCQIPGCESPAIFRCSVGFRYCAKHVHQHGARGAAHPFDRMALLERAHIEAAKETIRERIAAWTPESDS